MFGIFITAAAVALTAYLSILYKSPVLLSLFFAELLTVIPSALLLLAGVRKLSVKLKIPLSVTERNTETAVEVIFENKSFVPLPFIEAELAGQNNFEEKKHRTVIHVPVHGKSSAKTEVLYQSPHCGKIEFTIKKIRCYDFLHLFYVPVRAGQSAGLAVLPGFREVFPELPEGKILPESDSYDEHKSGDDPSEVFALREYRPGDSMHRVHWKMTARMDDLTVREFSSPLGCELVFFLQTAQGKPEQTDTYLDTFFSVGTALLESKYRYWLVWYDAKEELLHRLKIDSSDMLWEAMESVLSMNLPKQEQDLPGLYEQQFPNQPHTVELLLNGELKLFADGEEITYEAE